MEDVMDVVLLSRLQFAAATYFHFLFVPLTLGLSLVLAVMETIYVKTGNVRYKTMTQFWGRLFLINFAVGVVTGITLEFQFGTNWARYSRAVGDVFGPLLAIEATVAFFLESTFIAVWAFGWNRLSPKKHAVVIWLVACASNMSAAWILIANAWMQHPVGYLLKNGHPVLSDLMAVVTQKYALLTISHTLFAAYVVTGFFLMGISAYHILKGTFARDFITTFKAGAIMALIFSLFVIGEGHMHASDLAEKQPAKLASLETHWVTQDHAPIYALAIPHLDNSGNALEILPIPGIMSLLAYHSTSATVKGLNDIPQEDRPPVAIVYGAFRLMVTLGGLMLLLSGAAIVFYNRLSRKTWFLKILLYAIPLPYLVCLAGWTVAEVGRQPWIVYGLMRVDSAVSPIAASQVALSLGAFIVVYSIIGLCAFWLMARSVRRGLNGGIHA
jgi:cytochrome bd ubiquinol oxidase subunit I